MKGLDRMRKHFQKWLERTYPNPDSDRGANRKTINADNQAALAANYAYLYA